MMYHVEEDSVEALDATSFDALDVGEQDIVLC